MKKIRKIALLCVALCSAVAAQATTEGALPGVFSVSDSTKIVFSKGNLQYNAMAGTHQCADGTTQKGVWRFAENQWESIQNANENVSSNYDGWIDLFGYGTSGWNSGAICYQPWDTIKNNGNYVCSSLVEEYTYADWGVYNSISNGGNEPDLWYTPTRNEFRYLLTQRRNASQLLTKAIIDTIPGVILLPDNCLLPENTLKIPADTFTDNTLTFQQWSELEKYNLVFLPANNNIQAGTYSGGYGLVLGEYWSTTQKNQDTVYRAIYFHVRKNYKLGSGESGECKYFGFGVRLMQDAPKAFVNLGANEGGIAKGAGNYYIGDSVTISATPNDGYQFVQWSDGNKENPRTIVVTEDLSLSAEFTPLSSNCSLAEISVASKKIENFSADSTSYKVLFPYGTAESALPGKEAITYTLGDSTQNVVVNQITNKVFTVVVTAQNGATKTYVIEFVIADRTKLAVEVATNDILLGDVAGGDGIYYAGDSAKIGAVAFEGAQFYAWDNGVDQNPYNVLLSRDTTLTAIFLKEISEEIVTEITETSSEITIVANDSAEYYNHRQYCDCSHECHLVDIKIGNNGKVQEYNWDNNGKHCGWLKAPKKNAETNTISYTIDSLDANTNYYFVVETIDAKGQVIDKVAGSFKTADPTAVKNVTIDGLYVENGRIVCENVEDLRIYTVTGMDVTENNGSLQGVYIVKCGDKTSKVVVK